MTTTGETSHRILKGGDKAWELAGMSGTWHTVWSWLQFQVIFVSESGVAHSGQCLGGTP